MDYVPKVNIRPKNALRRGRIIHYAMLARMWIRGLAKLGLVCYGDTEGSGGLQKRERIFSSRQKALSEYNRNASNRLNYDDSYP